MKSLATLLAFVLLTSAAFAEGTFPVPTGEAIHVNSADGKVIGQVFTLFENEKAPVKGKVSLTDLDGNTISTSKTDDQGHFTFSDVEPGTYQAIGVAGDYIGNTKVVVSKLRESTETEDVYTAVPLPVAPAASSAIFDSYASLPAASFSPAPSFAFGGGSVGGCSSCGGGSGGGLGLRSFGGSCGGGCSGCCGGGGGLSFRRLALIGGAIAIPLALSGGDDDAASPVE